MDSKRFSRRSFLQFAGLGAAGALLAACAPQSAAPAPSEGEPAAEGQAAPPAEASLKGKSFTLWGLQYDPHIERYNMLTQAFQEKTGAQASVEPQPWPETRLLTAAAANVLPDVVCNMGKSSVFLIQQKVLLPIDDVVFASADVKIDEFFTPGSIGAFFWDGKYYGVPLEDNCVGMAAAIRTDWLEEAGDEAKALWPAANGKDAFESYEDMWALAEIMQQKDAEGNVSVWGLSSQSWDYTSILGIMKELGQEWWDPNEKKFFFDSEQCVEALRLFVYIPVFERKIETQLETSHMNALLAGKVALARGNHAMAGEAAKIDIPVESVLAPPAKKGGKLTLVGEGGWGFELPHKSQNQEIGVEFLKFMCTAEAQYIYAGIYGGTMTSCIPVMDSDIYQGDDPVKRSVRRDLACWAGTSYYGWGFGLPSAMENIVMQGCAKVRTGELLPEEAAKEMQQFMLEHYTQWIEGKVPTPEPS